MLKNRNLLLTILIVTAAVLAFTVPPIIEHVKDQQKPNTIVVEKYLLLICVDGECFDERDYITDQITLTEAIKTYGHPQWMHELNYDPNSPLPHGDE